MAQLERSRKSSESSKTPKGQHSPTFQQLIQGDIWQFSGTSTPSRQLYSATATPSRPFSATATPSRPFSATATPSRQFSAATTPSRSPADHEEDFSPPNSGRKSVFTKVKERAKKLRQSLSMKMRHGSGSLDHSPTTPSWGVSLEDDTDDEVDEDPEFLGAPMYESEQAPEALKESARQHPRAVPVVPQNHALPTPATVKQEDHETADSDASQNIASKISNLTVSVPEQNQKQKQTDHNLNAEYSDHQGKNNNNVDRENPEIGESISPQKWDKGVSVKEYFLNKLEPGEDDKALSQVISEAISPRKAFGEMGMVEKVKEAVTSFLRHEEPSSSPSPSRLSPNYRSLSTSPQPSRETAEATERISPSSKTPFAADSSNKVPSPNSISVTSAIPAYNNAAPLMSKKSTSPSSSSSVHKSFNTDVSPKSISKKDKPYVPISLSSSSAEEPSRQTTQAKGMSVRKNTSPNSISAIRVQPSSSQGEHSSKAAIKSPKAAANTPNPSSKTAPAQHQNIAFSANKSATSSGPMSRSKSLSAHMPIPNGANSSPIIPVSSNAREDWMLTAVTEEEAHGRILQMN